MGILEPGKETRIVGQRVALDGRVTIHNRRAAGIISAQTK